MVKLIAAIGALVLMAGLFRFFLSRPRWGILAVIATAPLEKLSLYAGITWKPFLLLTPPLVGALLYRRWKGQDPRLRLEQFEGMLLAVLLIGLGTLATAEVPAKTIRMLIQFAFLFSLTVALVHGLRSRQDFERAIGTLRASGFWVMLYGVVQFLGWVVGVNSHLLLRLIPGNPTTPYLFTIPGAVVIPKIGMIVRLSSTFLDWNIFAGFVLILFCLSFSQLCFRVYTGKPLRRELGYLLLASFILFFTFSRSAWIGMFVALLLLGLAWAPFFKRRRIQVALPILILLMTTGLATNFGPFGFIRTRMEMMFQGDASISKHAIYAQAALEMFRRSPALGIGLHNFSEYYTAHFDPNDFGSTAHSAYLSFFAESGLLGGVAHLILILIILKMLWLLRQSCRPQQQEYAWAMGLGAAYGGLMTSSFFYFFYNQVYLWVLIALIVALYRMIGDSQGYGNEQAINR